MSEEAHVEPEILDAVAAAAEALNSNRIHHADPNNGMDQHLLPLPSVHNPVHEDDEQEDTEDIRQEDTIKAEENEEHPPHQHAQELIDAMNLSLESHASIEALNASLHEPPLDMDPNDTSSLLAAIQQLQHTQRMQSQLILSMRDRIHYLTASTHKDNPYINNSTKTKQPPRLAQPIKDRTEQITTQLLQLNPILHTTDAEIDDILYTRHIPPQSWPVHRLKKWIEEPALQKLRLHRSEKYNHVPVRIPRTDKNKEGRLICKLCSGGKCNRNTTWMCSTCEVPLCIDANDGVMSTTHHVLWHSAFDLREEHERCNALLRERRLEKRRGGIMRDEERMEKRSRLMDGMEEVRHEGDDQVGYDGEEERGDLHHEGDLHGNEMHDGGELNGNEIHHGEEHDLHHGQLQEEQVGGVESLNVHVADEVL
jgi:hypothetical protein